MVKKKSQYVPIDVPVNWKNIANSLYEENALLKKANTQLGIALQKYHPEYKIQYRPRYVDDMPWTDVSNVRKVDNTFDSISKAMEVLESLVKLGSDDDFRIVSRTVSNWK